jgi:hypothetical protein
MPIGARIVSQMALSTHPKSPTASDTWPVAGCPFTDEWFEKQPTSTAALPDPRPLIENLTRCVIEILAGARDLSQISHWVTDDVYRHLLKRTVLAARARQAENRRVARPVFSIGTIVICEPVDGVIESVVVVRGRARARVVALRLEGIDRRWRATSLRVL